MPYPQKGLPKKDFSPNSIMNNLVLTDLSSPGIEALSSLSSIPSSKPYRYNKTMATATKTKLHIFLLNFTSFKYKNKKREVPAIHTRKPLRLLLDNNPNTVNATHIPVNNLYLYFKRRNKPHRDDMAIYTPYVFAATIVPARRLPCIIALIKFAAPCEIIDINTDTAPATKIAIITMLILYLSKS